MSNLRTQSIVVFSPTPNAHLCKIVSLFLTMMQENHKLPPEQQKEVCNCTHVALDWLFQLNPRISSCSHDPPAVRFHFLPARPRYITCPPESGVLSPDKENRLLKYTSQRIIDFYEQRRSYVHSDHLARRRDEAIKQSRNVDKLLFDKSLSMKGTNWPTAFFSSFFSLVSIV